MNTLCFLWLLHNKAPPLPLSLSLSLSLLHRVLPVVQDLYVKQQQVFLLLLFLLWYNFFIFCSSNEAVGVNGGWYRWDTSRNSDHGFCMCCFPGVLFFFASIGGLMLVWEWGRGTLQLTIIQGCNGSMTCRRQQRQTYYLQGSYSHGKPGKVMDF